MRIIYVLVLLLGGCFNQTLQDRADAYCMASAEPDKHLCAIGYILCLTPEHPAYGTAICAEFREKLGE